MPFFWLSPKPETPNMHPTCSSLFMCLVQISSSELGSRRYMRLPKRTFPIEDLGGRSKNIVELLTSHRRVAAPLVYAITTIYAHLMLTSYKLLNVRSVTDVCSRACQAEFFCVPFEACVTRRRQCFDYACPHASSA